MTLLEDANSSLRNSCVRLSCSGDRVLHRDCYDGHRHQTTFSHPHWDGFPDISLQSHVIFGFVALLIGITAILGNVAVIWTFCSGDRVLHRDCYDGHRHQTTFSHPHWDRFPDISLQSHVIFGFVTLLIGITAILGNVAVIWTFCRHRSLRSTANILIINLSVADLIMAIFVVFMHSTSALSGRWLFGRTGCMVYAASCALAAFVSISSMTVIALERHLVITQKFALTRILSKTKALRWCVGTWVYSIVLSCSPFVGWGRYVPEGVETSCTFDFFSRDWNNVSFVLTISIVGFAVPLLIICVCYMGILVAITHHETEIKKTAVVRSINQFRRHSQFTKTKTDIKTTKIIFSTVTLFCVSWLPYSIIAFIGIFGNACWITPLVSAIPGMVAKTATVFNPLVYALCHQRYKRKMQLLFRCLNKQALRRRRSALRLNLRLLTNNGSEESKELCRKVNPGMSFRSERASGQTSRGSQDVPPASVTCWIKSYPPSPNTKSI